MRIHAGQYYSCSNCDFKTLRNREFRDHKCKSKEFECQFCKKKCVSKDALRKHKKVTFCNEHDFIQLATF